MVAVNGLKNGAYLRPVAFRGYGEIGVAPKIDPPVEVAVAAWEWGKYLGADSEAEGVDVCVSSWQRVAPNTIPAMAKAAGNYLSSQLISMEAKRLGFVEGIGLSPDGTVSEGAGENLFLVRDGVIHTPGFAHSVLGGITRDSVITLARDLGYEVRETSIPREMLYIADELFFTGTAAESHADPLGGPHHGRHRPARPDHREAAEGVLRPVHRRHARQVRLARAGGHGGRAARRDRLTGRRPCPHQRRSSRRSGSGTKSCRKPPTRRR